MKRKVLFLIVAIVMGRNVFSQDILGLTVDGTNVVAFSPPVGADKQYEAILFPEIGLNNVTINLTLAEGVTLVGNLPTDFSDYSTPVKIRIMKDGSEVELPIKLKNIVPTKLPVSKKFANEVKPSLWTPTNENAIGWATTSVTETGNGTCRLNAEKSAFVMAFSDAPDVLHYEIAFTEAVWPDACVLDVESSPDGKNWVPVVQYNKDNITALSGSPTTDRYRENKISEYTKVVRFVYTKRESGAFSILTFGATKGVVNSVLETKTADNLIYWNADKNIEICTQEMIRKVEVFNVTGNRVLIQGETIINGSLLGKGIYVVKVICIDGSAFSAKITK